MKVVLGEVSRKTRPSVSRFARLALKNESRPSPRQWRLAPNPTLRVVACVGVLSSLSTSAYRRITDSSGLICARTILLD
jgi:hypothetical protein